MTAWLFAMGTFALVGSITPGPVNILAIRQGSSAGLGVAIAYVLGASVSYTLVVWMMGEGGERLVRIPLAMNAMQWAGAAYLIYLAFRIGLAPAAGLLSAGEQPRNSAWHAGLSACVAQSFNPKAWMVALSGVGIFVLPQADVRTALQTFCAISFLACAFGVGSWALAGRILSRWLAIPARQKRFNQLMGLLLASSVASMLR